MQDKRNQTTPPVTPRLKKTRSDDKAPPIIQPVHPTDKYCVKVLKKKEKRQEKKASGETQGWSRGNTDIPDRRKTATKARARYDRSDVIKIKALGELQYWLMHCIAI